MLPVDRQHPYEAQLDALEEVLCADLVTDTLGMGKITSTAELTVLLERYRITLLEPVELSTISHAHHLASRGRARELIKLDEAFLGNHPEWLRLSAGSIRFGNDCLSRLRPLRDERVVQRMIEAVRFGKTPGHHLTVFGLTMAAFSIAPRQGLVDYAQAALKAVVATTTETLKLTQADCKLLLARSHAPLPKAIDRMVA